MCFQDELLAIMREQRVTQADIVRRTGVSSGWVSSMVRSGRVPSRETIETMVEGLGLNAAQSSRLLGAAGYSSPHVTASGAELPSPVADVAWEMTGLSPKQLETVRRLVEQPERIDAIAALLGDRRVMHPLALSSHSAGAGVFSTP
jgi:transcriptional regulator with XRE-family HTH domain